MMNIIKKAVSNRNVVLVALLAAASQTVLAGGYAVPLLNLPSRKARPLCLKAACW